MSDRNHINGTRNGHTPSARTIVLLALALLMVGAVPMAGSPADVSTTSTPASALSAALSANAGPDQVAYYGNTTYFNGTGTVTDFRLSQLTYNWTVQDNGTTYLDGQRPFYIFSSTGVYTVTLNVTDPLDQVSSDDVVVTVTPYPYTGPNRVLVQGVDSLEVSFNATATARALSNADITSFNWTISKRDTVLATFDTPAASYTFTKPGNYTVVLTLVDANGMTGQKSIFVKITAQPTFYEKHWVFVFIDIPILVIIVYILFSKWRKGAGLITKTDKEKAKLQYKTFKKDWSIFRHNRLGFAGLIVLFMFLGMAMLAPVLSTVPNPDQHEEPRIPDPNDPTEAIWENPLPPSLKPSPYTGWTHPLGTDHKGQDVYSLTLYGSRASLLVGIIATAISVILGAVIGLGAGYFGKVTDEVLMRVTDFFLVLPWFPLMIVMMAILGQKFIWVVVVIGITSWPSTARVVRSQVLTVKERQFIVRAKCVGASDAHIIRTHIMPNVLPLIFANTVLLIAIAIFSEAFLDFFGLGDPSVISWGAMLEAAYEQEAFKAGAWWWIAAPGVSIVGMVLAFSLVGYAIDDVLNPKLRRR